MEFEWDSSTAGFEACLVSAELFMKTNAPLLHSLQPIIEQSKHIYTEPEPRSGKDLATFTFTICK